MRPGEMVCGIDDKDQPLDDKNSGFGGNTEGIVWTVMGADNIAEILVFLLLHEVVAPGGELLNVSGGRDLQMGWRGRGQDVRWKRG